MIYLAGPLSHPDPAVQAENIDRATRAYLTLVGHGIPAICPHLSALHPAAFNIGYDTWIDQGLAQLHRCSAIWLLPKWELSGGARIEYEAAQRREIDHYTRLAAILTEYGVPPLQAFLFFSDTEYGDGDPA